MSQHQSPPPSAWPLGPDVNAFARKGASDGRLLNAGAAHLRTGLDYIGYRAQADLITSDGTPFVPPDTPDSTPEEANGSPKGSRAHKESRLKSRARWVFPLIVLIFSGLLGVGVTQGAFYIFDQSPRDTLLMTLAVELLFLYSAYVIGARLRAWQSIGRAGRWVTITLLATTALTALAVVVIRVLALGSDTASVGLLPKLVMFGSLALLLIVAAVDTGLHGLNAGPKSDPPRLEVMQGGTAQPGTNRWASDPAEIQNQRLEHQTARHSQWMACLFTYLQAYRAAAAPELMPELEDIEPNQIPYPTRRRAQGEPSREAS